MIDTYIFLHGSFELESVDYIIKEAKSKNCDVFIDVGANIGVHSLSLARAGIQEIWAFEPDPRNFCQLKANIWLNQSVAKVRAHQMALADVSGSKKFWLAPKFRTFGDYQHNIMLSGFTSRSDSHGEWVETDCSTLDDVLKAHGRRLAIKIDVEGHEMDVLRGMSQTLQNNFGIVVLEVWESDADNANSIREYLAAFGYQCNANRIGFDMCFAPRNTN